MEKVSGPELKMGDLVLVEFAVKRFVPRNLADDDSARTSQSRSPKKGNFRYSDKREWNNWEVGFDLAAVSLLFRGSAYYQPPEPPSEDVTF